MGVVMMVMMNLVDMLKTRLYVANVAVSGGANVLMVRGMFVDVFVWYGLFGLFRGFSVNYM